MELGKVVEVVETARRAVEIPDELREPEDAETVDDVDVDAPTA
ncbi:MAG: hypothetical protein AAFZ07_07440 [Actinomycetota bacterium]